MSTKYKFRDPDKLYFITFTVINWIDVFIRDEYRNVLLESLEYCKKYKNLELYAWCIMTSHVHLIVGSHNKPMQDIVRDMKSYTSHKIREEIEHNPQESRKEWMLWMMKRAGKWNSNNIDFQLWQQGSHPVELSDNAIIEQKLDYLHNNPVVAGFVSQAEDYVYSSARDYAGEKGLIEIKLIE